MLKSYSHQVSSSGPMATESVPTPTSVQPPSSPTQPNSDDQEGGLK